MRHRPTGPRPGWQHEATCRGGGESLFFDDTRENRDAAVRLCAVCPVRLDCLEHAVRENITIGIWGGTTERERRAIVLDRRRAARARR